MMGSINKEIRSVEFLRNAFGKKWRKPEKIRGTKRRLRFLISKVRVRLNLIKIKCMIAEITINMLGISFESFEN